MIDLKNKTILVTGSSRGIGKAILETCHAAGANVVLHYGRSGAAAEAIRGELGAERCLAVQGELGELGDIQRLWQAAVAWKGKVDVLVNNASIRIDLDLSTADTEWDAAWRKVLDVNLIGPAHLSRMAVRHFQQSGGGSIVNIASRPAFRGDTATCPHDGAAKGGLVSLTRQIARHYGGDNVKAFVVAPGIIETDQASEFFEVSGRGPWLEEIPAGRFGRPADIANIVAFLASGLGDYATGSTIDVNGASYVH
ncbi:SDR family NAD(P)-dependent oxidoreductase [Aminobacter carboxidus]|jgi:3-oxoacyl-[acyl-carrier protein] reductase|uniref:SDR family oxidoreductase n=1 Tax=Aminobacter carboxidus TaxID=376165 RepID=A0ABR9GQW2_9HYPH|nr:SDR family oxidoreductase [Aminobacter carboxidus]MBE1206062.1 SDR family oxidoreductase [Aminobacter carboxidus]